jgi:hypothetical protein
LAARAIDNHQGLASKSSVEVKTHRGFESNPFRSSSALMSRRWQVLRVFQPDQNAVQLVRVTRNGHELSCNGRGKEKPGIFQPFRIVQGCHLTVVLGLSLFNLALALTTERFLQSVLGSFPFSAGICNRAIRVA